MNGQTVGTGLAHRVHQRCVRDDLARMQSDPDRHRLFTELRRIADRQRRFTREQRVTLPCARGAPKNARMPSPSVRTTVPSNRATASHIASSAGFRRRIASSASSRATSSVELTKSANSTVTPKLAVNDLDYARNRSRARRATPLVQCAARGPRKRQNQVDWRVRKSSM